MSSWIGRAKALYLHLPAPLRTVAASAFGYTLARRRFGRESERLVAEALARDGWSAEQWDAWRAERLHALLERAATRVPFYREHWARRREAGDTASWTELENWPILDKDTLRERAPDLVAEDVPRGSLVELSTSGTTGAPISLWRSHETDQAWYALFEARLRRWFGADRTTRWAMLGSKSVVPPGQRHPPFWVWNAGMQQLYLSGLHVGRDTVGAYLDAIRKHGVTHLVGYPSSLYAMAWMAEEQGLSGPRLRFVLSNAEPLTPERRAAIGRLFGCEVYDTYGMVEIAAAASECAHGSLHLWPEVGVIEAVDAEYRPVPAGTVGEFLCTGLLNADMPLIRYRVGDRGALAPDDGQPCACGRRLPLMLGLEGRTIDNLVAPDGRRIFAWEPTVFHDIPLRERQVTQFALDRIDVAVVPIPGFDEASERAIVARFRELLGAVDVVVRRVDEIPRTASGKFRSIVSHVAQR